MNLCIEFWCGNEIFVHRKTIGLHKNIIGKYTSIKMLAFFCSLVRTYSKHVMQCVVWNKPVKFTIQSYLPFEYNVNKNKSQTNGTWQLPQADRKKETNEELCKTSSIEMIKAYIYSSILNKMILFACAFTSNKIYVTRSLIQIIML